MLSIWLIDKVFLVCLFRSALLFLHAQYSRMGGCGWGRWSPSISRSLWLFAIFIRNNRYWTWTESLEMRCVIVSRRLNEPTQIWGNTSMTSSRFLIYDKNDYIYVYGMAFQFQFQFIDTTHGIGLFAVECIERVPQPRQRSLYSLFIVIWICKMLKSDTCCGKNGKHFLGSSDALRACVIEPKHDQDAEKVATLMNISFNCAIH